MCQRKGNKMKTRKTFFQMMVFSALVCFGVASCGGNSGSPSSVKLERISITAAESKTTLVIGETVQLTASVEGVTWSSENTDYATVSESGLVTAAANGSTTIKAKKDGYRDGSITITVSKPAAPHLAEPTWPAECPALIDTSAWTAGQAAKNAYNKDYIPLTGSDGSVGVKIAMTDYDPDSASTFDAESKLGTDATSYVKFSLKAPKAGVYQMIVKASCSATGDDYPFAGESSRGFDVKVNGYEDQDNVYGARLWTDANLDHDEKRQFIFALVQLNGPEYEDTIEFRNPYYRMKFDTNSDLIFAENK